MSGPRWEREDGPPPTMTDVMREVMTLQDQLTDTRGEAMHPDTVAQAVELGLMRAVANPQFWTAATVAMQAHAAREAGGWLLGGISVLFKRAMWVGLIGMGIYTIGGWSALAKAWAALKGTP